MNHLFHLRLALDLIAAGLLVFGLSYWWLGNVAHELAGTAMFLLIIVHNMFNRRWYGAIARTYPQPRSLFNIAATGLLAIAMLVLLLTSILISSALSGIMSAYGGFTVRQIHTLAAYWALIIVAVHLGLRWPVILAATRQLLRLPKAGKGRKLVLRLMGAAIAVQGIASSFALGLGDKLAMRMTLDWWNFGESVAGFFIHCIAIAGLYIFLTYYGTRWLQGRKAIPASADRPSPDWRLP